jgi:CDP-6-deoxy-D-xylo-4-hexulose-3-dehydrase
MEVIRSGWITQGKYVEQFEKDFAKYVGVKYAIMVNSGSSANLVALSALNEKRNLKYKYVITTPATFATSVFPIIQIGAIPVFVDVDDESYCINPDLVEEAIRHFGRDLTGAILPVDLMGHPSDCKRLCEIADKYNLFIMFDSCEAHGAECYGKKVGAWGDCSTFSFFVAHHITSGEGGAITTNNEEIAELARSIRAFGRMEEIAKVKSGDEKVKRYKLISKRLGLFDTRMTFVRLGYNMRMTDLQAAIGVEQLKKFPDFLERRRQNAEYIIKHLEPYSDYLQLPKTKKWAKHAWHHVAILVKDDAPFTRFDIADHLEKNGVETRTIEAGNMVRQPALEGKNYHVFGELINADKIWKNGFMVGCHQGLVKEDLDYMIQVFAEFLERHKK